MEEKRLPAKPTGGNKAKKGGNERRMERGEGEKLFLGSLLLFTFRPPTSPGLARTKDPPSHPPSSSSFFFSPGMIPSIPDAALFGRLFRGGSGCILPNHEKEMVIFFLPVIVLLLLRRLPVYIPPSFLLNKYTHAHAHPDRRAGFGIDGERRRRKSRLVMVVDSAGRRKTGGRASAYYNQSQNAPGSMKKKEEDPTLSYPSSTKAPSFLHLSGRAPNRDEERNPAWRQTHRPLYAGEAGRDAGDDYDDDEDQGRERGRGMVHARVCVYMS